MHNLADRSTKHIEVRLLEQDRIAPPFLTPTPTHSSIKENEVQRARNESNENGKKTTNNHLPKGLKSDKVNR